MADMTLPRTQRKFRTIWGELEYLCKKIHHWLYVKNDRFSARRFLHRLERLLEKLPKNDLALLQAEGLALVNTLQGDKNKAIKYRKREIELMEDLHREAGASRYRDSTGNSCCQVAKAMFFWNDERF